MKSTVLVLSCEHAGNEVPAEYKPLFTQKEAVLNTHLALDFGAQSIAQHLSEAFDCDYTQITLTRLLIDCNRSLKHPHCFSEFTKSLSSFEKNKLIEHYYVPFRNKTEQIIKQHIANGEQVLHLSIHSFTPELHGIKRNAAISLLYDPRRHGEKEVARIWQNLLSHHRPGFRIRLNYPYQGKSDGFTTTLRKQFKQQDYLGFEVECNQALTMSTQTLHQVFDALTNSLKDLMQIL